MKIFIDTADINEIKKYAWIVDGVTTNPSLIAAVGIDMSQLLPEILKTIKSPVSVEVLSSAWQDMVDEGRRYAKLSDNVVIKLPITEDGLRACQVLSKEGISTNMTLCFSVNQAVLAAKCGATYISPFIGRIDDLGYSGIKVLKEICDVVSKYFSSLIIAASIRSLNHVSACATSGADIITIPPKIIEALFYNPLTDIGLSKFKNDYNNRII